MLIFAAAVLSGPLSWLPALTCQQARETALLCHRVVLEDADADPIPGILADSCDNPRRLELTSCAVARGTPRQQSNCGRATTRIAMRKIRRRQVQSGAARRSATAERNRRG